MGRRVFVLGLVSALVLGGLWINRNIVYAVDYTRGIDILRYTGPGTDGPITNANRRSTGRG